MTILQHILNRFPNELEARMSEKYGYATPISEAFKYQKIEIITFLMQLKPKNVIFQMINAHIDNYELVERNGSFALYFEEDMEMTKK